MSGCIFQAVCVESRRSLSIARSDVSYKFVDLRSESKPDQWTLATDPDSTLDVTQDFVEESDGKVQDGSCVTTSSTNASSTSSQTLVAGLKRKADKVMRLKFLFCREVKIKFSVSWFLLVLPIKNFWFIS